MNEPIRVLHVITGMGSGGAEAFIMNLYRNIDHNLIQFDFLLCSDENIYKDELTQYGSRIFRVPKYTRHFFQNAIQTRNFFRNHHYQIVHVHANSLMHMAPLAAAKHAAVPCRIMHSHSTSLQCKPLLILHRLNKLLLNRWATDYLACSEAAGKWMFTDNYTVVNNAIDLQKFSYDAAARIALRKELNIPDDAFVLGHVGRFFEVKNHTFLLDIFEKVVAENPKSFLILVGNGPLEQEIYTKASHQGLLNKIRFLGVRKDVHKVLNSMDVFVLPSLYEGLGIVAIEAQANGLPIFCSTHIPKEASITSYIQFLSLSASPTDWAQKILKTHLPRMNMYPELLDSKYNIKIEATKMQNFYLSKRQK